MQAQRQVQSDSSPTQGLFAGPHLFDLVVQSKKEMAEDEGEGMLEINMFSTNHWSHDDNSSRI